MINRLIKTKKIKEHYLLDNNGSFVLFDDLGKATGLMILTKKQLDEYYDIAFHSTASNRVIDALKNHQKSPLLIDEMDHKKPVSEWDDLLYDITQFESCSKLFYAIIDDKQLRKFEGAVSYHTYKNTI